MITVEADPKTSLIWLRNKTDGKDYSFNLEQALTISRAIRTAVLYLLDDQELELMERCKRKDQNSRLSIA